MLYKSPAEEVEEENEDRQLSLGGLPVVYRADIFILVVPV